MRQNITSLLVFLSLLVLISVDSVTASVLPVDIFLGNTSTIASNHNTHDEVYVHATLSNHSNVTCSFTLTNFKFVSNASVISNNNLNISIFPGTSLIIKMRVPETLDAINRTTLLPNQELLGNYSCSNATSVVSYGSVYMQRKNEFKLQKVAFSFGPDQYLPWYYPITIPGPGSNVVFGVKPNDILTIKVFGMNNFQGNKNISLNMDVDFVDFDNDIYFNDSKNLTLNSPYQGSVILSALVDRSIISYPPYSEYSGYITVFGNDDFGAYHGEKLPFSIFVTRDGGLEILSVTTSPSYLICNGSNMSALIDIENTGYTSVQLIGIEFASMPSGTFFQPFFPPIDINSTRRIQNSINFSILNTTPGTYNATVTAAINSYGLPVKKNITIQIPNCSSPIMCVNDSQCGLSYTANSCIDSNNMTFNSQQFTPMCTNPNTIASACELEITELNKTVCDSFCTLAGCSSIFNECSTNSDCGSSYPVRQCSGDNNLTLMWYTAVPTCIWNLDNSSRCEDLPMGTVMQECLTSCSNVVGCAITECSDGIDNDFDGQIDFLSDFLSDTDCTSYNDNSESSGVIPVVVPANKLSINKVTADVDGSTTRLKNNDKIEDLKPGDSFDLEIELENSFAENTDMDMDVDVEIDCDNEIELDDTSDSTSISADDKDTLTFSAKIDDDADDKMYKCVITATGIDDNQTTYTDSWNIKVDVTREKYQLALSSFTLSSSSLSCGEKIVQGTFRVTNIGSKKDKNAKVMVTVPTLKIYQTVDNLVMESDKSIKRNFEFNLPTKIKAGNYQVIASAYSQGSEITDSKTLMLVVPDCSSDEEKLVSQNRTVTPVIQQPYIPPSVVLVQPTGQNIPLHNTRTCFLIWCWD